MKRNKREAVAVGVDDVPDWDATRSFAVLLVLFCSPLCFLNIHYFSVTYLSSPRIQILGSVFCASYEVESHWTVVNSKEQLWQCLVQSYSCILGA